MLVFMFCKSDLAFLKNKFDRIVCLLEFLKFAKSFEQIGELQRLAEFFKFLMRVLIEDVMNELGLMLNVLNLPRICVINLLKFV